MPDQDRIHADLLLAEKRTAAALDAAVTARDRMARRLALAYQRPKYLAVGQDGLLRDFGDNADEPLPADSEVAAVVGAVNRLRRELDDIRRRLAELT